MMKEIKFKTWTECVRHIDDFDNLWSEDKGNRVFFRGHGDSKWPLQTTLERRVGLHSTMKQYAEQALRYNEEVEATTGRLWGLPTCIEVVAALDEQYSRHDYHKIPCYPYLAYLRQHGFASPLLDWTRSPLIASYFAFSTAPPGAEDVAIFVFTETGEKRPANNAPTISVHDPFASTHKRHFFQQSWYTTASMWVANKRDMQFVGHESVLEQFPGDQKVHKMTLPASECKTALRWLSRANINHYSLFGNEDALIRAIDSRVFDID